MLTNAELLELTHFKAELRSKMSLNIELSTLAVNKAYCRDILTQAEKYALNNNDENLKVTLNAIRHLIDA